jgi:hypothetical protein
MNCKQGELAFVVRSAAGNDGKIVRCVRLATLDEVNAAQMMPDKGAYWVIDRVLPTVLGRLTTLAPDAWLRPIRPEADPVTTDVVAGVEA